MQTFNQTILNSMIEKAISALEKSEFADGLSLYRLRQLPFTINTRMRVKGGACFYIRQRYSGVISSIRIEISHSYCLLGSEQDIYNVVTHELAHAYQLLLIGDTNHGYRWRKIDMSMGGSGEEFHTLPVQKNQVQRHKIVDNRNGKLYTISTRRWNQIKCLKMEDGKDRFVKQESYIKPQLVPMSNDPAH